MHTPELILALFLLGALTLYALFGGADYGGGVWDLLAWGERGQQQRELISNAIAPVWEANHVWLILAVVLTFAGFPPAFAAITTALNIPLTLLLIGIVLRGSSFVFRAYHTADYRTQRRWGLIFAVASAITPLFLGIVVGAVSSGKIVMANGTSVNGFIEPWLGVFPLMTGFFTLAIFTFLAAVYLTVEARDPKLQGDFRRKALASGVVVAIMALGTFLAAKHGAPGFYARLTNPSWVWLVQGATAVYSVAALVALVIRRYKAARIAAMFQVGLILWGWALSQAPYFLEGQLTIWDAASSPTVLWSIIGATFAGMLVLFPSIGYLMRIFKDNEQDIPLH